MVDITYNDAVDFIYNARSKVGLDGVKQVLRQLGNPQNAFAVIHVAGTNGKGSVCAFLNYILIAAGYKTGLFTSPHIAKYNERIKINNNLISDTDFADALAQITQYSTDMSFFENLTCMAYSYFASQNVDIAIIEIGIGGRLDSTNVVDNPILSVITAPGYDHTELLGNTLTQLALEDAGIIKNNCPVAVYPTPSLATFTAVAAAKQAPLYYLGDTAKITDVSYTINNTIFSVDTPYFSYKALQIQLLGEHQIQNAIHALLCTEVLRKQKLNIPNKAVQDGLLNCKWQGRFELFRQKPTIVLDGAHNEDGAKVFRQAMSLYFAQHSPIVLIVAISQKKDYAAILQHMLHNNPIISHVICTCSSFKPMAAQELAIFVQSQTQATIHVQPNCRIALQKAQQLANPNGIVAVAGSLYLIGDLRETIVNNQNNPSKTQ